MKEYFINLPYRGRWFDLRFCCKTDKEAAIRMGVSLYQIKNYANHIKTDNPYTEIWAKPYSHNAKELLGRDEVLFDEAKRLIDIEAERISKSWKL